MTRRIRDWLRCLRLIRRFFIPAGHGTDSGAVCRRTYGAKDFVFAGGAARVGGDIPAASLYQRMDGIFVGQILRGTSFLSLNPAGLSPDFHRRYAINS